MSEHQRVAFRAIDGPVSEKNLEFMHRQSSRAEITAWSFDNEYNFGDFRGNAEEMLRRGYDFHFHYANFGIRKLLIRLPHGLPDASAAQYLGDELVAWKPDKHGPGGILEISPFHEPGDLEDIWELDSVVERLMPLRAEILDGDLRPLYLAHLAMALDSNHAPAETIEGPVPAGLGDLTDAQLALADLYGISAALLAAAAEGAPVMGKMGDPRSQYLSWLQAVPQATKDDWLVQAMLDPRPSARTEILASYRNERNVPAWPTIVRGRSIAMLEERAAAIHAEMDRIAKVKATQKRAKHLAKIAADPSSALREAEELVRQRGRENYQKAAELLADVREALGATKQANLAILHAKKLAAAFPTLNTLKSELRSKGLLAK